MLSLQLFGSPLVRVDGQTIPHFRSAKSVALLAYLVINRQTRHSRSTLLNLLWPDVPESNARQNLSQTLTRLRDALGAAADLIVANRQAIWVAETAVIDLDLHAFDRLLAEVGQHKHEQTTACADCLAKLAQAVALARGELLAGLEIGDSLAFEEWLLLERERIHQLLLDALTTLAEGGLKNGRYETAIDHARHQIALEPWREIAHRQLIQALALSGRRNAALAQYEACRATLRQELGVEPTQLTQQLVTAVRKGTHTRSQPPQPTNAPTNNLAHHLTTFIGREAEINTILTRFTEEEATRLITITGPGGIGKTRLAQEIGRRLLTHPPQAWGLEGVWFISFVGVSDADNVPLTIANVLNLPLPDKANAATAVAQHLSPRRLLLILDNFEYLIESRDWLLQLLQTAPGIRLIITSREYLRLLAEQRLTLLGLAAPPEATPHTQALNYDASRLFLDRARRLFPDFRLTAVNWPHIAQICRLIEGLPLGLELAATLLEDFSPSEIVSRITTDAATLATTYHDIAPHQRSIHHVFAQSWARLSPTEQNVLSRLSIFASNEFSLSAAIQVANAQRHHLNALIRKSLIYTSTSTTYTLHPLYKEFARRKLPADQIELQRTYVNYFTNLLIEAVPPHFDKQKHLQLRSLLPFLPDLRACWHSVVKTAVAPPITALAPPFYRLLRETAQLQEGRNLYETAWAYLQTAWPQPERDLPQQIALAHIAAHLGFFRLFRGDPQGAYPLLKFALSEHDRLHIAEDRDKALAAYSSTLGRLGKYDTRLALWQKELALAKIENDAAHLQNTTASLGEALYHMGRLTEASQLFRQSIAIAPSHTPDYKTAITINNLGITELALGNLSEARVWLEKSLEIRLQYANTYRIASARLALGALATIEGDYTTAQQQLDTALAQYTESGRSEKLGPVHLELARLALKREEFTTAEHHIRQALRYARQFQSVTQELEGVWRWGEYLWITGQHGAAQEALAYVLRHEKTSGLLAWEVRAFLAAHQVMLDSGKVSNDVAWQW